jgi:hypothetical protein
VLNPINAFVLCLADRCVKTDSLAVLGHSAPTGIERPRFRTNARRNASRRLTPVIQHLGDMRDSPGAFAKSKDQVVVLRTVESGTKSAKVHDK